VEALRAEGRYSVPTRLGDERRWNPFLRSHEAAVVAAASTFADTPVAAGVSTFAALRRWKDGFR
jgi:hydroxyacylglutathione hydrolase